MFNSSTQTKDKQAITDIMLARKQAHRERNADAIVAPFAHDAIIYDLAPPLVHQGVDHQEVKTWLATWDGPIELDAHSVDIAVSNPIAIVICLNRMQGVQGSVKQDIWFRTTTCLRKVTGAWQIVHEHSSVPFYMDGSYRAAVELQP